MGFSPNARPLWAKAQATFRSAVLHSAFVAKPPKAALRMTAGFFDALRDGSSAALPRQRRRLAKPHLKLPAAGGVVGVGGGVEIIWEFHGTNS